MSNQEQQLLRSKQFIVQKYIEAPMLFNQRKFDIRVWALLHSERLYVFREGYCRTSSEVFSYSNDIYVHLTNNAVQKFAKTYGQYEDANILPLNAIVDAATIMPIIHHQITQSYLACFPKLKLSQQSFELVGYDFMLTSQQ